MTDDKGPNVWPAVLCFIALFLGNVTASFPIGVAAMFVFARRGEPLSLDLFKLPALMERLPTLMTFSLVCTVGVTTAVGLGAFAIAREPILARIFAPSRLGNGALTVAALFLGSIGYGAVTTWLTVALGQFEGSNLDAFERLCVSAGPIAAGVLIVVGGIGPGFGEELVFRGFIQPRVAARWSPAIGIAVASILFGFMHMDLVQGAFAVGVGVLYGWVAWRSGTLWLSMAAHALNNSASFALTRLMGRTDPAVVPPPAEVAPWIAALFLGVGILVWQNLRASERDQPHVQ